MTNAGYDSKPGKPRFNQKLFLYPFIGGAWALAVFTTSDGFSQVLSGGWKFKLISYAMSIFLGVVAAFASIQLGAAVANRLLGRSAEGRYGDRGLIIFVFAFALTASASGLFSYSFWHEQFYKISARETDARELPLALERTLMTKLEDAANLASGQENATILASPDIKEWLKNGPAALSKLAGVDDGDFKRALQESQDKAHEQSKKARERLDALSAQIKTLDHDIAAATAQYAAVDHGLQDLAAEPALKLAQSTAAQEKQAAQQAQAGADASKIAVCGPNCKGHQAKMHEAEREAQRLLAALRPQMAERAQLKGLLDDKNKARSDAQSQRDALTGGSSPAPLAAAGEDLPSAMAAFASAPRNDTLHSLEAACERVADVARRAFPNNADLKGFECTFKGVEGGAALDKRQAHLDAGAAWRKTCDYSAGLDQKDNLPARIRAISDHAGAPGAPPAQSLQEARKLIDSCITTADALGLPQDKISDLESDVEAFVRKHGLDRNEFERATGELFRWPPTAAALAGLLIAGFIELSILVFKVLTDIVTASRISVAPTSRAPILDVGDDRDEPPTLRAYKALYRNLRPAKGDTDEIRDQDIDSDDVDEKLRANVRAIAMSLVRSGRARRTKAGFRISHAAIAAQIEPLLRGPDPAQTSAAKGDATPPREDGSAAAKDWRQPPYADGGRHEPAPGSSSSGGRSAQGRPKTLGERLRAQLGSDRDGRGVF